MSTELILYKSKDGVVQLEIQLEQEMIWLSLNQLATLFDRDKSVISRHLRNIYKEGELKREATVAKNATVQNEAGREVVRNIEYFNLDAIISAGYRINSKRGTEFRIWATSVLRQHIVQGYTVNEKRLKELKQTHRRQRPRCHDPHDCRKPSTGKRGYHRHVGEFNCELGITTKNTKYTKRNHENPVILSKYTPYLCASSAAGGKKSEIRRRN